MFLFVQLSRPDLSKYGNYNLLDVCRYHRCEFHLELSSEHNKSSHVQVIQSPSTSITPLTRSGLVWRIPCMLIRILNSRWYRYDADLTVFGSETLMMTDDRHLVFCVTFDSDLKF